MDNIHSKMGLQKNYKLVICKLKIENHSTVNISYNATNLLPTTYYPQPHPHVLLQRNKTHPDTIHQIEGI